MHTAHGPVAGEPAITISIADHPAARRAFRSRYPLDDGCTDPAAQPVGTTLAQHSFSIAETVQRAFRRPPRQLG